MKFNIKKFNDFFENSSYEQDIKEFVLSLYEKYLTNDVNIIEAKTSLLDLGFYEAEEDDITEEDINDYYIIDFYRLSQINKSFRSSIIKFIIENLENNSTDFFTDMIVEDMKIFIHYEDWKLIKRKNKLENLSKIKE